MMRIRTAILFAAILALIAPLSGFAAKEFTFKTYVSKEGKYSIDYPKGWTIKATKDDIMMEERKNDPQGARVFIATLLLKKEITLDQVTNQVIEQNKKDIPGYKVVGKQVLTETPNTMEFAASFTQEGIQYRAYNVIKFVKGIGFLAIFSIPASRAGQMNGKDLVFKILPTLRFDVQPKEPAKTHK